MDPGYFRENVLAPPVVLGRRFGHIEPSGAEAGPRPFPFRAGEGRWTQRLRSCMGLSLMRSPRGVLSPTLRWGVRFSGYAPSDVVEVWDCRRARRRTSGYVPVWDCRRGYVPVWDCRGRPGATGGYPRFQCGYVPGWDCHRGYVPVWDCRSVAPCDRHRLSGRYPGYPGMLRSPS